MGFLRTVFVCSLLVLSLVPTTVIADESTSGVSWDDADVTYVDSDGNGTLDTVHARVDFTDDGRMDIIVVRDSEGFSEPNDWTTVVDYRNQLLLYDEGADGDAEVAVQFRASGQSREAAIYSFDGASERYDVRESELLQSELTDPAVEMNSSSPWVRDGDVTYDVTLSVREPVRSAFTYNQFADVADRIRTNVTVVDRDDDGQPDHEIRQIRTDLSSTSGHMRTEFMVNTGTESTIDPDDGLLWPYLGSSDRSSYIKPYGEAPPPIQVDWENGSVEEVGEFVASRGDDDNYFVYTQIRLTEDRVNELEFEYPFAFYDLANDDDGRPELQVRAEFHPEGSQRPLGIYPQRSPTTVNEIRYSWDQNNDDLWNYKLGGVVTTPYENTTTLGPYEFYSPGYTQFPEWTRSQRWESVTWVVAPQGRQGTEGIYEGGYNQEQERISLGLQERTGRLFEGTQPGFRLEAADSYDRSPLLYKSPVDDRWHLYDLSYGYWNRSSDQLSYRNTNDDPFIDEWTLRDDGRTSSLLVTDWGVAHVQGERVELKYTELERDATVRRPPATTAEWREFGELTPNESSREDSETLGDHFSRLDGRTETITGVDVESATVVDDEIRLFGAASESLQTSSGTVAPGTDVVVVADRAQSVIHAEPHPNIQLRDVQLGSSTAQVGERVRVVAVVENTGWQRGENVTIRLEEDGREVTTRTLAVEGQSTVNASLSWWPTEPAATATVVVVSDDSNTQREIRFSDQSASASTNLQQSVSTVWSPLVSVGAALMILFGVVVVWREAFIQ